jgi:benzoate membrane transport protein
MSKSPLMQPVTAGLVTAFVGFAGSFAVVLKGLLSAGASEAQAASGLMALSIATGLVGMGLSLRYKMPISGAWSTSGAALLAATGAVEGGFEAAVGAFIVVGVMVVVTGLLKPLAKAVTKIPSSLANAMLAGVLFGLVLQPIRALILDPLPAALIIVAWFLISRWKRAWSTPVAAIVAIAIIAARGGGAGLTFEGAMPTLHGIEPYFTPSAVISIALPLFVVTMASQNLPGVAVLQAYDYRPNPGPLIAITGLATLAAAPFGGHSVNLSAITAAMCASPEASPDRKLRWIASFVCGFAMIVFGLFAGAITHFAAGGPVLVEAVAGLALLSSFGQSLHNALADAQEREAALVTFVVAASGVGFHGIGGAFWGLLAGAVVLGLTRYGAFSPQRPGRTG